MGLQIIIIDGKKINVFTGYKQFVKWHEEEDRKETKVKKRAGRKAKKKGRKKSA